MGNAGPGSARRFGRYQIVGKIATGGMADIFLAAQRSLAGFEKLLVVKRILAHLEKEPRFVQMFLNEARIAARLNHQNVVQIYDLGVIEGRLFITMEYLQGESLSTILKTLRARQERLSPELATGIVLQVAEGLQHAHTARGPDGEPLNIVHRDVSPQNIFVVYEGTVKVVDFGIAKAATSSEKTRTGVLKGKYPYMSPEQISSRTLDPRSDIFALGSVLWECLTGRRLFHQDSDLELMRSISHRDASRPTEVVADLPETLVSVVMRALARDRDERFQTAAELRDALAGVLKTLPGDADTAALSGMMQEMFGERIMQKRALVAGALAGAESGDYLFDDLEKHLFETKSLTPHSDVHAAYSPPVARPRRRMALPAAIVLIAVAAALAALLFLDLREANEEPVTPDGPTLREAVDAHVAAAAEPPDSIEEADAGVRPAEDRVPKRKKTDVRRKQHRANAKKRKRPRQPPEPPPEAPRTPGKLRLVTVPWTDVYLDGKHLGQTPLMDVLLPPGNHKLRALNKEKGIDRTVMVRIKPGEVNFQRVVF